MSVPSATGEFVGELAEPLDDHGSRQCGEIRRLRGRLGLGRQAGQPERSPLVDSQGGGDGDDARGLRWPWLVCPVVDRGAADVAALGEPGLGAAHLGEGDFDQVEERLGGGVVAHAFMCTEMARADVPVALATCGKSWLELARHGKRALGVSHVYLTRAQACGRLNISPPTLAKRIRDGELVAIKTGEARSAHVKVSLASIEEYEKRRQIRREGAAA